MADYSATVSSPHPPGEVWKYLADLRSIAEWDPSVEDARLISGEPRAPDALYELDVSFLGRTVTLTYRTAEVEEGRHVAFVAEDDQLSVRDEATISPSPVSPGGSTVVWDANLELKGARRLLDRPLALAFNRIGGRAERGLAERLGDPLAR
jgi:hypothetical protein